ncbi:MAG: hypothetical protein U9N86_02980 [Bacteroidota bacterium]|nr:hypothetical protein [Bacteroidota bacterium]
MTLKYILGLAFLILVSACEDEADIYLPSKSIPIVHAVFNDRDSLHTVYLTKSFGAQRDAMYSAQNPDSLYFHDASVTVGFKSRGWNSWDNNQTKKIFASSKDSGFFRYPGNQFYQLEYDLNLSVDSIRVQVVIPDYDIVEARIERVQKLKIVAPMNAQQYIYLVPDTPLIILWDQGGHAWSELDISFEFIEETAQGFRSKWVNIQNTQYYLSPFEKYRQLALPYDEFISQVIHQIDEDPEVLRTYIGYVKLHIVGGGSEMVEYMKYINGFTDYNFNGYTNVLNGLGLVASATETFKDSLRFDRETRQTLLNETRLKKLKISPWVK